MGNDEQRLRNNRLSPLPYEVQELGKESDDRCDLLVAVLKELKTKLLDSRSYQRSQVPTMLSPGHGI